MASDEATRANVVVVGSVVVVRVVVVLVLDVTEVWVVVNGVNEVHELRIPWFLHVSSAFTVRQVPHVAGQNANRHC